MTVEVYALFPQIEVLEQRGIVGPLGERVLTNWVPNGAELSLDHFNANICQQPSCKCRRDSTSTLENPQRRCPLAIDITIQSPLMNADRSRLP